MAAPKEFSGKLGDAFPNIEAPSTFGDLKLHDYWGDGWVSQCSDRGTPSFCLSASAAPQLIRAATFSALCGSTDRLDTAPVGHVGLEPASGAA